MTRIQIASAPTAIGPYSQAICVGQLLFISGQLPIDPATGEFAATDAVRQSRPCLANIVAINEEYGKAFWAPFPARACYEVAALPKGALAEIEAVIAC